MCRTSSSVNFPGVVFSSECKSYLFDRALKGCLSSTSVDVEGELCAAEGFIDLTRSLAWFEMHDPDGGVAQVYLVAI